MPLEDLFDNSINDVEDLKEKAYAAYGITHNPFPSGSSTSGHPHMDIPQDTIIINKIKDFMREQDSKVIVLTASQGIGKTNVLNAYAHFLKNKISNHGYYVVRFFTDPEPTFDPLLKSILSLLGKEHLELLVKTFKALDKDKKDSILSPINTPEFRKILENLSLIQEVEELSSKAELAYQWLLGLPVRKAHTEALGVLFRLDTIESKTRVLKDLVEVSVACGCLKGIFILIDELEKQGGLLSQSAVVKYLSALRALIDALPKHLFLMLALTTDAAQRYYELLPALKGRLATEVKLTPIRNRADAIAIFQFYYTKALQEAKSEARDNSWDSPGSLQIISDEEFDTIYNDVSSVTKTTIEGVRQRDFLHALHEAASKKISKLST